MYKALPKKVKIVATIGLASDSPEILNKLALAGVDVFRFNMSHCTREQAERCAKVIRAAEERLKRPLHIMADLMGPKIRIGKIPANNIIRTGDIVKIVPGTETAEYGTLPLNIPDVFANMQPGDTVYLGDGNVKLDVIERKKEVIHTKAAIGGEIWSYRAFFTESLSRAHFALTTKDKADLKIALAVGADSVAISFVQGPDDVRALQKLFPKGHSLPIIAKIETRAGVERASEILDVAHGIMIARGDLGLSVPMAEIPHLQKALIRLGLERGKPIITATQMMESMTTNFLPTRAEVTDVANAILDGTDTLMLSGETAQGQHPVQVVKTMREIIRVAKEKLLPLDFPADAVGMRAVSASVAKVTARVGAKLIIVFTEKGDTARRVARHKPTQPILALSADHQTLHTLNFTWGLHPRLIKRIKTVDEMIATARAVVLKNNVATLKKGDSYVISAGIPFGKSGGTNLILVQKV